MALKCHHHNEMVLFPVLWTKLQRELRISNLTLLQQHNSTAVDISTCTPGEAVEGDLGVVEWEWGGQGDLLVDLGGDEGVGVLTMDSTSVEAEDKDEGEEALLSA